MVRDLYGTVREKMKIPYSLTDYEIEILREGKENPQVYMDYWFRPFGSVKGWQFDGNFTPAGAWQLEAAIASQSNVIISGGIGSGKTVGVGMAAAYFCGTVHPDFKFMNAAPTAYQAGQMHEEILKQAAGCPFEKLIWNRRYRPYPKIEIRFKVGPVLVSSLMEFMSVSDNARNIFTYEGDWINVEEAALLDNLDEVMLSLGTRLRGSYRGRARMGRLSLISNPWDNPYFWYIFDMCEGDPENYLSMYVSTKSNQNITPKQLDNIIKRIPIADRERFIEGKRPEGRGNFFNKAKISMCEDQYMGAIIEGKVENKVEGYRLQRDTGVGVSYFQTPYDKSRQYMIFGDLGTDSAPNRNSPVVGVFDVTLFPEIPASLAAFWWGNGEGSIRPFLKWLLRFAEEYRPLVTGVDSTGTQKYTAEITNSFLAGKDSKDMNWVGVGHELKLKEGFRITGMDFSGPKKTAYLRSAAFLVEAELLSWPSIVTGIRSQLGNYDPERDKPGKKGIPQDLVAMISMASYAIRRHFYVALPDEDQTDDENVVDGSADRALRLATNERSSRSSQRYGSRR